MIYIIGSLRSARPREVANILREHGHNVFDDWHACGPEADTIWRNYEIERGRTYAEALRSPFAQHAFNFDLKHIQASDIGVLVLPAGKSGHLELGYMIGRGSQGYILFEDEPERWDLMYLLAHGLFFNVDDLVRHLGE
jgi:hypothetical protein